VCHGSAKCHCGHGYIRARALWNVESVHHAGMNTLNASKRVNARWWPSLGLAASLLWGAPVAQATNLCAGLTSYMVNPIIGGSPMNVCNLPAKALLVVNTASECGFTPQYGSLEKLYQRYKARGLVVVGIPANDFGGQEPRKNADIGSFCEVNYGVTFPVAEKLTLPLQSDPLFARLIAATKDAPMWNFHKYLITPDGKVTSFSTPTDPLSPKVVRAVENALIGMK